MMKTRLLFVILTTEGKVPARTGYRGRGAELYVKHLGELIDG